LKLGLVIVPVRQPVERRVRVDVKIVMHAYE